MKKKSLTENPIITFDNKIINLIEFNEKSEKEQKLIIENVLKEIYQDNLEITNKHIMKVLRLTWSPKDEYVYLPYKLKVSKEKLALKTKKISFSLLKQITLGEGSSRGKDICIPMADLLMYGRNQHTIVK